MEDCELSSLELYESDWICVKSGIFEKGADKSGADKSSAAGKCNFGKKRKEGQTAPKLKFLCAWNQNEEALAISAREGSGKARGWEMGRARVWRGKGRTREGRGKGREGEGKREGREGEGRERYG